MQAGGRAGDFNYELIEAGRRKRKLHTRQLTEFLRQVTRLGQVVLRQRAQAALAVHGKENGHGQGAQRLIGANVRGGLLPPDVLLARGQREHKAAAALRVGGLAHQPPGQAADKLLLGRQHSDKRPSVADRQAERLCFQRYDVGLRRRANQSQRHWFGDGSYQ